MTFKDLKKRINSSNQKLQTQSFDKLQNKPFWIWNIEEHKLEDIRTKGECCFNHIIGLPTKEGDNQINIDYDRIKNDLQLKIVRTSKSDTSSTNE
jgi:hypothetical protein